MSNRKFTVLILAVGSKDELQYKINSTKEILSCKGYTVTVDYIPLYNTYRIMNCLEFWCDQNKVNIIHIICEYENNMNIVTLTTEVIDEMTGSIVKPYVLELQSELRNDCLKAVCGIRNMTLILFSPYVDVELFFTTNEKKIFEIMQNTIDKFSTRSISDKYLEKIKDIAEEYKHISSSPIVSVSQTINIMNSVVAELSAPKFELVNVNDAYGRILYNNVFSKCTMPPFRTSAIDGFAVIANDGKTTKTILETKNTFSNRQSYIIRPGTCIWTKIGAPIPDEATAVVDIRNTSLVITEYDIYDKDDITEEQSIEIKTQPKEGENINHVGSEISYGACILNKYTRIGPAEIGLLTRYNNKEVTVYKHQSVGIMSIKDEYEEPSNITRSKYIYSNSDSNMYLIELLKQEDFDALNLGFINYSTENIIYKIEENLEEVDVIVIKGFANDKDILKPILRGYFNAIIHFGAVDMKPGKSTTYATCTYKSKIKHFFCLSRNPAIVPIAAHLFILPLLNALRCYQKEWPLVATRIQSIPELHSRPRYIWTSLKWKKNEDGTTCPWVFDMSNRYTQNANAILRLPPRTENTLKLMSENELFITIFLGRK